MAEVEVWVVVDANGDYEVGPCQDSAHTHYRDNVGEIDGPTRMVRVVLSVPLPTAVEVRAELPAEPDGVAVEVG